MSNKLNNLEVRTPYPLLMAPLPDWVKLVWIAMRSFQGPKEACDKSCRTIGERCPKEDGKSRDRSQVHTAQKLLEKHGFLRRHSNGNWCCINPESVEHHSTLGGDRVLSTIQQGVEHHSTLSEKVLSRVQQGVEQGSTPSINQLINQPFKPTIKPTTPRVPYSKVRDSWNDFARANSLPQIEKMSDKRKDFVKARFSEVWPIIEDVYSGILSDNFYTGGGKRGWVIDFDHVWGKRDAALRIAEKYKNLKSNGSNNRNTSRRNGKSGTDWNALAFGDGKA